MHFLYFIREREFYARTHAKITPHWKSTLKESTELREQIGLNLVHDKWIFYLISQKSPWSWSQLSAIHVNGYISLYAAFRLAW